MKRRVLIIDDEPDITQLLGQQLEATNGYETLGLTTAAHALPMVRSWRPDVIVMDLLMPGVRGSEVAARLAEDGALRQIPIIFLTGAVTEECAARAGVVGRHQCLTKPVHLHTLLLAIETACAPDATSDGPRRRAA
ncbi:MAG: response regulator [Candidatus Omnitrophica bacterium]|nr:response regulator [Candidatus Omnitrophota bacterium]